jgi:GDP-mannose pyrophosphatase NudK
MKQHEGGGNTDEEGNIELLKLDFEKAFKMTESGKIKDGKTIMLLYYLKLHNTMDSSFDVRFHVFSLPHFCYCLVF